MSDSKVAATVPAEQEDAGEIKEAEQEYHDEVRVLAKQLEARAHRTDGEAHPTSDVEKMALGINALRGCYFIGHTNTDVDSVASAIGAATLYGGTATRSEQEVNGEIVFACEFSEIDLPPYFGDLPKAYDPFNKEEGICLVDHNEPEQMHKLLGPIAFGKGGSPEQAAMFKRIHGVIDHHALCESFSTAGPVLIDVRPWGSACSILMHNYIRVGMPVPKGVARMLLCGILSDTVNLTSPTTTPADKLFATLASHLGDVPDPTAIATEMFKAKTKYLTELSPFAICRADQKNFTMAGFRIGWATVEVTEPQKVLAKNDHLLLELRVLKKEKNLDFAFLSVVDIDKHQSWLLLCGSKEVKLAQKAFGGPLSAAYEATETFEMLCASHMLTIDQTMMDLGAKISRKKDFIPPVKEAISSGFTVEEAVIKVTEEEETAPNTQSMHECTNGGCVLERVYTPDTRRVAYLTPKLGRDKMTGFQSISSPLPHRHPHDHGSPKPRHAHADMLSPSMARLMQNME